MFTHLRKEKCQDLKENLQNGTDIELVGLWPWPYNKINFNVAGVDCDEVYPGIVLGNGATVKKKEYLTSIGISHILNAAEFRGVNVGEDFYSSTFKYFGLRVEDTPQTQICRFVHSNFSLWAKLKFTCFS